jgi:hypothetical protein
VNTQIDFSKTQASQEGTAALKSILFFTPLRRYRFFFRV